MTDTSNPVPTDTILGDADLGQLTEAIVKGYDEARLTQILRFNWGFELAEWINVRQGFRLVVGDLVKYAQDQGKALELLKLAYAKNGGNPYLKAAAAKFHVASTEAVAAYADTPPPKPESLEALVNKRSRLLSFSRFMADLRRAGERICLVETPLTKGTGFLVGVDLVLTNYHVVKGVIANPSLAAKIRCRFDYQQNEDGTKSKSKQFALAAGWELAHSPYSDSDVTGKGEPAPGELDYALLRLAKKVGETAGSDGPRGWFTMPKDTPIVALNDVVVIPQHAAGRPLEIAWGTIAAFPASGMRLRYDVTTEPGSSGSPCFSADMDLIGLHHAAEPTTDPTFNQAVPLWRIAGDLSSKAVLTAG